MSADRFDPRLTRFGFRLERGGAHLARSSMFKELRQLLASESDPATPKDHFRKVIESENCLGKRSARARALTTRHLVELYALDPTVPLFRALRFLWSRDPDGQPLLALTLAYCRDAILRSSAPYILPLPPGTGVSTKSTVQFLEGQYPERFSPAMLKSAAQNLNTTWTASGHLNGKLRKVRTLARPTAGSVVFALFLGYLTGQRGLLLFQTEYVKLLDCSPGQALDLAEIASTRGWVVLKRIGDVVEVLFPQLIRESEMEWLREQD